MTPKESPLKQRKHIRLKHFDYGNTGAYYVTICTDEKKRFLSEIENGEVRLLAFGKVVEEELDRTISMRDNLSLGPYVIMPNHVHLVLFFHDRTAEELPEEDESPKRNFGGSHAGSLSSIIGNFKSVVTSRIRKADQKDGIVIWQRGFYEHIIRDEKDLLRITDYIMTNPITWQYDQENPDRVTKPEEGGI
jgi:REP element-mobilizing transposase RayT